MEGKKKKSKTEEPQVSSSYWEMYWDTTNKSYYYYNPATEQTTWELPKGAICANMAGDVAKEEEEEHKA
jgi:hypothetical protein